MRSETILASGNMVTLNRRVVSAKHIAVSLTVAVGASLARAAFLAVQDVIEKENLLENIRNQGSYFGMTA